MKLSTAILLSIFISCFAQAQFQQVNPQGPAFQFTDAHLFDDQSLYLATGHPFLVKVSDLNDTDWRKNYRVFYTDSFNVYHFEVLSKSIFAVGPNFTDDGGKTFRYLRGPNDREIYFKDGQRWALIDKQKQLFYTTDAANTWQQAPGTSWHYWNPSQNSLIFYRKTDTTAWQFTEDSLYKVVNLKRAYTGFNDYIWFHQLDTFRYAFEQQRRVFVYDTIRDTLAMDTNHFFQASATRIYVEGKRIIREEPTGKMQYANDHHLNWVTKNPGYNGPSFALSNGVTFYNSYLPFTTFGEGNLGFFRLNGNHKMLLGLNRHPLTGQVYATNDSNLFFSPPMHYSPNFRGKFFDFTGKVVADDSARLSFDYVEFQQGKPGIAFTNQFAYQSTNNGLTWQNKRNAASYTGNSSGGSYIDMHYSLSGPCLWAMVQENSSSNTLHVGRTSGNGNFTSRPINQLYFGSYIKRNQLLALSCDTAAVLLNGVFMLSTSGPQGFSKPAWMDTLLVYSINHNGKEAILNTHAGFYTSPDLVTWNRVSDAVFDAPIMAVIGKGNYYGLRDYHLYMSRDSGHSVQKVVLPFSPLKSIAVVHNRHLMLGGAFGQLYLFKNAATVNPFVGQGEETQAEVVYFPNPATYFFTLQWPGMGSGKVRIYSLSGELVQENSFSDQTEMRLDISGLKTGIHILQIEVNGKQRQVKLLKN